MKIALVCLLLTACRNPSEHCHNVTVQNAGQCYATGRCYFQADNQFWYQSDKLETPGAKVRVCEKTP